MNENLSRVDDPQTAPAWHTLAAEQALERLTCSPERGLSADEARRRLAACGPNALREAKPRSPWRMLLEQFSSFLILVLIAAALISGAIGEVEDSVAILIIVVLNAVIGFIQEYRAERAMAALKKLAASSARVLRDGALRQIPAAGLVPGDVVLLEAGDAVPADLRLLEAIALQTAEAALTGESEPIEKHSRPLAEADLPVGDRHNMAFKGTVVTYGRGRGVAVATGMQTELGRIATLLASAGDVRTPLQNRLEHFGRKLALAALAICALVFVAGLARGEPLVLMFLTSVSLAVAAIPEALPAVVTISLALGARRMVRKNALVRHLPAVETLGSVTYVCSDKTGTLTQNRMRVERIHCAAAARATLLRAMALNNDATLGADGREIGDPTEIALALAALEAGYLREELEAVTPRIAELPFDSERKRMTTVHRDATGAVTYTKGAPERTIERCERMETAAGSVPIDAAATLAEAERMAREGLRVIAFAYRRWPDSPGALAADRVETGLVFVGLVGMMDPPRPEAAESVALCRSAGITPVMVTGDHPATAQAIAARLGIARGDSLVLTGRELAKLDVAAFAERVRDVHVYARVDPAQKIRIVEALQAKGECVAMTGDGVNDAPAIKRAEIGIAMGRIGTDVAREASHMVLLDDNFATIVAAVREGRRIYDNIRKFVRFVLGGNAGEIWVILLAPFLGLPLPLVPIQILWINLVTDGLPGLALAAEPAEPRVMSRPPRPPSESIFAHGLWQQVLWVGLLIGALCLGTQAWTIAQGSAHWQTMVFTVLCLCQLYQALAIRSERESVFAIGLASNPHLLGAVLLTYALQLAVIYHPALNAIFKTEPLSPAELAFCTLLPSAVFFAVELEKWLVRRGVLYRSDAMLAGGAAPPAT